MPNKIDTSKRFTAVILAAGMGSRLKAITKNRPKPLIEVAGKSLIAHAIDWSKDLGATKIVVVGGYLGELLKEVVLAIDPGVIFVSNEEYATSQRMESLLRAQSVVEGGLYVRDADYLFDSELAAVVKGNCEGMDIFGVNSDKKGVGLDMRMMVRAGNLVTMGKELVDFNSFFCTQIFFEERSVAKLFEAGRDVIKAHGNKMVHIEDALLRLVAKGEKIRYVNLGEPRFVEVDTVDELELAKKLVTPLGSGVRVGLI